MSKESYFAEFGWVSEDRDLKLPNAQTNWHCDKEILNAGETATLSWHNEQNVAFYIYVHLDDNYLFHITQRVGNNSSDPITISSYGLISKAIEHKADSNSILHEGPIGVFKNILSECPYDDLKLNDKKTYSDNQRGDWFGITDKYWLTAIIPANQDHFGVDFIHSLKNNKNRFQVDYASQSNIVEPNTIFDEAKYLFTGAKKLKLLDQYSEQHNIKLFDRAVDFGRLYFLTKPIFTALQYLNSILGNFGLAILVLTVIVKLIMFPLASKSYQSMNRMKILQPHVANLKERYANDKMQLNKEMMALYKREGVNPLSGCMPLILQIPVFFSLYKVLYVTLEMRHAPFFGWIHDLSAPDPTTMFNLFGLIPWDPPSFLVVGIWPIIMGVTMFFTAKNEPRASRPCPGSSDEIFAFNFYIYV